MASYLLNATRLARFFVLIGGLAITAQAGGQTNSTPNPAPTQKATTQSKLTVSSNQPWTDAQVDVHLGDVVQIRARSGKGDCSSDGNNNGSKQSLPSTALAGALNGKIDNGTPFPVGATQTPNIDQQGRLSFGMNGSGKPPCNGDIEVELQITAAPLPELKLSNTALDPGLAKDLDSVPRRFNDQFKNLGDMVNFVIVGPQQELQAALSAAHWQLADQSTSVQTFLGSRNTGVKRNGLPARVSPRTELPGALVLGSRREFDRGEWKQFQDGLLLLRPVGSVAYKLALVAARLADATWTLVPKHEWDVAAGTALVQAAGGIVRNLDGSPVTFNSDKPLLPGLIAAGPNLYSEISDVLEIPS